MMGGFIPATLVISFISEVDLNTLRIGVASFQGSKLFPQDHTDRLILESVLIRGVVYVTLP